MSKLGYIIIFFAISALVVMATAQTTKKQTWQPEDNLADVLNSLGQKYPDHYLSDYDSIEIQRGYDLIHIGKTEPPEGMVSRPISKFYTCTSCHNVEREDPQLNVVDQDARLDYAIENDLPFLQGSTFWGTVNHETWYNDDYVLKYGDLVKDAKNSLKGSIQLCAKVCSQGRELKSWEMESILAYMWSLQMKMSDLDISKKEKDIFNQLQEQDSDSAANYLKSFYLTKSPATFAEMPKSKEKGYPLEGRPNYGKAIYELGCQHCHHAYGESDLVLDNSVFTFRWLKKNMTENSKESIYEIIRKGSYSELGHKEYMPNYTLEKMSHQQVEDLRAYIEMNLK